MANPRRFTATVTTAADGSATAYLPGSGEQPISGRIETIIYTKTDYAVGVDFTITLEATGEALWVDTNVDASEGVHPVAAAALTTGVASTILQVPIVAADDRVKIVIAAGGVTKTGTFTVITS